MLWVAWPTLHSQWLVAFNSGATHISPLCLPLLLLSLLKSRLTPSHSSSLPYLPCHQVSDFFLPMESLLTFSFSLLSFLFSCLLLMGVFQLFQCFPHPQWHHSSLHPLVLSMDIPTDIQIQEGTTYSSLSTVSTVPGTWLTIYWIFYKWILKKAI